MRNELWTHIIWVHKLPKIEYVLHIQVARVVEPACILYNSLICQALPLDRVPTIEYASVAIKAIALKYIPSPPMCKAQNPSPMYHPMDRGHDTTGNMGQSCKRLCVEESRSREEA